MPEHPVGPGGQGAFSTITEAIAAAAPGDRILLQPGRYEEQLVIDKEGLEIIATGDGAVVEASRGDVVVSQAPTARIAGLSIRQLGGGDVRIEIGDEETQIQTQFGQWAAVRVAAGRLCVEDCDLISEDMFGLLIAGGADPVIRGNRIHDGHMIGIAALGGASGTVEGNDLFGHAGAGVAVMDGGHLTLRSNRIHHNGEAGVALYRSGQALVEDNEIFENAFAGVEVTGGAEATVSRNHIHTGREHGVKVSDGAAATVEQNEIIENGMCGVVVMNAAATLRSNRIQANQHGVGISEGRVAVEDNVVTDNRLAGLVLENGAEATIRQNTINGHPVGITVSGNASGAVEDNNLSKNGKAFDVPLMSRRRLRRARNQE